MRRRRWTHVSVWCIINDLRLIPWPFSHPLSGSACLLLPLRSFTHPFFLLSLPRTSATLPVFSIIIPFFLISLFHQLLLPLSCFCYLCLRRFPTAKMSNMSWVSPPLCCLLLETCLTATLYCIMLYDIWYYMSGCYYTLTSHLCACSLGITYFLSRLI